MLAGGIANQESAGDVLPQTGLISHEYTMFLYELLLTEPSAIIDVYNDMVVSVSENSRTTIPDDDFEEGMEVLHAHEYRENLNPTLRRKWKTAYLADTVAARIFSSGLLEVWYSEEEY